MPGLVACSRRWDIGSDDLMFPAFAEIWVRLAWLIAVSAIVDTHKNSFVCSSGYLVQTYYIGMLVILSSHIVVDALLMIISSRGTISDPRPRRAIPYLLYVKLSLFLPELLWTVLGTYWAFDDSTDCPKTVVLAIKIAAVVGWVTLLCLSVGLFVVFDPLGHRNFVDDDSSSATRKLWETRCRVICCCAGCDQQNTDVFSDIARLITDYFKGVDLVPTDVAAGLLLVHQVQSRRQSNFRYERIPVGRTRAASNENDSQAGNTSQVDNIPATFDHAEVLVDVSDNTDILPLSATGKTVDPLTQQPSPTSRTNPYGITITPELHSSISQPNGCPSSLQDQQNGTTLPQNRTSVPSTSSASCVEVEPMNVDIGDGPSDTLEPQPWMGVHNAAYYMKFALATYSWPVYMYMNIFTGACNLWPKCRCCSCNNSSEHVTHDNCCACHTAAILKITHVQESDIIYASFYNQIYEIPFIVMMDHNKRSIVVAIRGTMSLKDALTDLSADSENCHIEGLGEQYVHKGILQAAKYIENTLENLNLLDRAFQKGPDYRLVITGHSLGAGAATLLAVLLRPKYRNLVCYAFSPPGWLLSYELSRYTEQFVCSVIIGNDVIPRLGLITMEKLKVQILTQVHECHKPKFRVLAGGCWRAFCGKGEDKSGHVNRRLVDQSRPTYYTQEQDGLEEAIHESERSCVCAVPLYMPGIVLFLEEEEPTRGCFETPVYRPVWARAEHFSDIVVHPTMLTDHFPDAVLRALQDTDERDARPQYMLSPASSTA